MSSFVAIALPLLLGVLGALPLAWLIKVLVGMLASVRVISFMTAYLYSALIVVSTFVFGFVFGFIFAGTYFDKDAYLLLFTGVSSFLFALALFSTSIKDINGKAVGLWKGFALSLIVTGITLLVMLILFVVAM